MSGYAFMIASCIACDATFAGNPNHGPSIPVNGKREPICRNCFDRWNEIHRTSTGLEAHPLHPQAYEPIEEGEL